MVTPDQFRAKLLQAAERMSLPFHELKVTPAFVTVKCDSQGAADRWCGLLAAVGLKTNGVHAWKDYAKRNEGTVLVPSTVQRWLTGGQFS